MDLSDIEKGNFNVNVNYPSALLEIYRMTAANKASIEALVALLIDYSPIFAGRTKEELYDELNKNFETRHNEIWADFINHMERTSINKDGK